MSHSTVTSKGQTTIPRDVRIALKIKSGCPLLYTVEGDQVRIQVQVGASSVKGALASEKGRNLSFKEIRTIAAAKVQRK